MEQAQGLAGTPDTILPSMCLRTDKNAGAAADEIATKHEHIAPLNTVAALMPTAVKQEPIDPSVATQKVLGAGGSATGGPQADPPAIRSAASAVDALKAGVELNVETTPQSVSGAAAPAERWEPPAKRSAVTAMELLKTGVDINAEINLSRQERQALNKKFARSQEMASQRTTRSKKCPEEMALKMKQDKVLARKCFNVWYQCGEDWGEVTIVEHYIRETTRGKHAKKYGGQRKRSRTSMALRLHKTSSRQSKTWRTNGDRTPTAQDVSRPYST